LFNKDVEEEEHECDDGSVDAVGDEMN